MSCYEEVTNALHKNGFLVTLTGICRINTWGDIKVFQDNNGVIWTYFPVCWGYNLRPI